MIRKAWSWLADEPHHLIGARALQIAIGCLVMFRVLTELPFAQYFWGPHGIGVAGSSAFFGARLGAIADRAFHNEWSTYALLVAVGVGGLSLITGYRTRAATALTLLGFVMFERRLPEILDGGDNITRLALVYMLFLLPARARVARQSLAVWLHNIAVVAIVSQLLILYGTSGMMKAAGDRWHHGTALFVVSQVEWFSVPWVRSIFKNPYFTTLATYSTMLFQIWFPVAVFSRFKLIWLAAGIFFHINIAVVMGLLTFSTAMIGLELFLITDEEFRRLRDLGRRSIDAVRRRLGLAKAAPPLFALYIDGYCQHCRKAARAIDRLDIAGRISVRSFRHHTDYLEFGILPGAVERRMHVVALGSRRVSEGFAAVRVLARALILLWPLRPMLWLLDTAGLGGRAYDGPAARRRIVPDPRACAAGACSRRSANDHRSEREVA